jgi:hypothetical protein
MFSVQCKRCFATNSSKFCFRIYNYRILSKSEEFETAGGLQLLLQAYYYNSLAKTNILRIKKNRERSRSKFREN